MPGGGHDRHGPPGAFYRSIFDVAVGQVKSGGVRCRGDFADWLSNLSAGDRRLHNSYGRRSIVLLVIRWSFVAGSYQPLAFCDQRQSLVRRGTSGSGKCCQAGGKGEVYPPGKISVDEIGAGLCSILVPGAKSGRTALHRTEKLAREAWFGPDALEMGGLAGAQTKQNGPPTAGSTVVRASMAIKCAYREKGRRGGAVDDNQAAKAANR